MSVSTRKSQSKCAAQASEAIHEACESAGYRDGCWRSPKIDQAARFALTSRQRIQTWNKDKLVGQKTPLRLRDIWAIRVRVQLRTAIRDLALFNLAIDSKLRACDLVKLRVRDVADGERISQLHREGPKRVRS